MSPTGGDKILEEGNAVIAWLNCLPVFSDRNGRSITLESVADGHDLWKVLQELNPEYFEGELPEGKQESGRWVKNLQNLKKIHKHLRGYLAEVSKDTLPNGPPEVDIKAVAESSDDAETATFLMWVFVAAARSEGNSDFMNAAFHITPEQQGILMGAFQNFGQDEDGARDEGTQPPPSPTKMPVDVDLYNEEVYGKLVAENKRLERERKDLQRDCRDLANRLSRVQEHNGMLLEDLGKAQDQIKNAKENLSDSLRVRDLENKVQGQDDHIAGLEDQLAEYANQEQAMTAELTKLRKSNEQIQALQDLADELKVERDALARKNNALERYKVKLQSAQDVENENRDLRRELEESRHMSKEGDDVKQRYISLQREVSELKTLMANTEIQVVEAQTRKRQIEIENAQLYDELEAVRTQLRNVQERQGLDVEGEGLPNVDLSEEMEGTMRRDTEVNEDLKLKNEALSKESSDATARSLALQQLLDQEREKRDELDKKYLAAYEKSLMYEESLKNPSEIEGSSAYKDLLTKLEASEELAKKNEGLQEEYHRKLQESQKTIASLGKQELEQAEAFKELHSADLREREAKVITQDSRIKDLEKELDDHRKMLSQALSRPQGASDESFREMFNKITKEQNDEKDKELQELLTKMEKENEKFTNQSKDLESAQGEVETLKKQLQEATSKAAPALLKASQQAALKQELENSRRENRLMATAFHDLAGRLQLNNVALQRRPEAPRSFLNKQRQLINQATALRTR